jgi:SAM-dependent methyltransferase
LVADREALERKIRDFGAVQPWNHNFLLPHGLETRPGAQDSHGRNLIKLERIKPLLEAIGVRGKRILDLGCNEGYFSFYLASQGADVLGIDIDPHRIEKAQFIGSVLENAAVDFRVMDIYGGDFAALPRFDLCLCMGFLHRVPDPYSALAALGAKSDLMLLEWKALKFGHHDDAFAYFSPKEIDRDDYFGTEYWLVSYAALERILKRLGFSRFHRVDDPTQRRAILVAGKVDNPVFARPDVIGHRGRVRALLSHTRRYLRTVLGILSGRTNA